MIDHIGFNVADFQRSRSFYQAALGALGWQIVMEGEGWAMMGQQGRPKLWFGTYGAPPGRFHLAFSAANREQVRAFYAAAMAHGGQDNGPPGIRAHYHPDYYGAFVIDPDGLNVEAVCHLPE